MPTYQDADGRRWKSVQAPLDPPPPPPLILRCWNCGERFDANDLGLNEGDPCPDCQEAGQTDCGEVICLSEDYPYGEL